MLQQNAIALIDVFNVGDVELRKTRAQIQVFLVAQRQQRVHQIGSLLLGNLPSRLLPNASESIAILLHLAQKIRIVGLIVPRR